MDRATDFEIPSPKRMRLEALGPEAPLGLATTVDDMDDIYGTPPARAEGLIKMSPVTALGPDRARSPVAQKYQQLPGLGLLGDSPDLPRKAEQLQSSAWDVPETALDTSTTGKAANSEVIEEVQTSQEDGLSGAAGNERVAIPETPSFECVATENSAPELDATESNAHEDQSSEKEIGKIKEQWHKKPQEVPLETRPSYIPIHDSLENAGSQPTFESQPTSTNPQITSEVQREEVEDVGPPQGINENDATGMNGINGSTEFTEPVVPIVPTFEEIAEANKSNEGAEFELDSSPLESESSLDSSSDSSSSDDSDAEDYEMLGPEEEARRLMAEDGGSDDDGPRKGSKMGARPLRTLNEKPDEVVPKPDVIVTEDMKIQELGRVENMVENLALIKANVSGEYQVLEFGSVLCLESKSVIGVIAETLGRVQQPYYSVRFTNAAAITDSGLSKNTKIFYVEQHSRSVFTQPLKAFKGSDASNLHDEEVGDDELEFSDDEAEAEHKRQTKLQKRAKHEARGNQNDGLSKGPRQPFSGSINGTAAHGFSNGLHPVPERPPDASEASLNYDEADGMSINGHEDGDDLYTPLQRPNNLHEMMRRKEPPVERRANRGSTLRGTRAGGRGGRTRQRGDRGTERGGRNQRRDQDDRGRNDHTHAHPSVGQGFPPKPQSNGINPHPLNGLPPRPPQQSNGYRPSSPHNRTGFTTPSQLSPMMPPAHQAYTSSMQSHSHPSYAPQYPPLSGQYSHQPQYFRQQYQPPSVPQSSLPTYQPQFPAQQTPPVPASSASIPAGAHINPAFFRQQAQPSPQPWQQLQAYGSSSRQQYQYQQASPANGILGSRHIPPGPQGSWKGAQGNLPDLLKGLSGGNGSPL
ncbi:hypothetical protein MMC28_005945 [Mycoblastus sanguinarius]|nr:hypothetical protein [Mycoblastus sanguinarius]